MSRWRNRGPGGAKAGEPVRAPTAWLGLAPILALCAVVLALSVLAYERRGGAEMVAEDAPLTDSVPAELKTWDEFFARYPFDDGFMKCRIKRANGSAPDTVVEIPLKAGEACRETGSNA
jgi:hypothetical protein